MPNSNIILNPTSPSRGDVAGRPSGDRGTRDVARSSEREPVGYLATVKGPEEDLVVEVVDDCYVIGRGSNATLRIKDERMSREHSLLLISPDRSVMIVDLHSSNGTVVNGRKIKKAKLSHGDRVDVGHSTLMFVAERPSSPVWRETKRQREEPTVVSGEICV